MSPSEARPFAVEQGEGALLLRGRLELVDGPQIWNELRHAATAAAAADERLDLDLSKVEGIDGVIVALLVELRTRLRESGVASDLIGATARVSALVSVYGGYQPPAPRPGRAPFGFVEHFGEDARAAGHAVRTMVEFVGDTVLGAIDAVIHPFTGKRGNALTLIARAGTDAMVLVLLLNFVLGLVMGYESSSQLERYGAQLYIADVVGVGTTRELAPVMTSIIVLGRSGAAYAAELGTMKVSEELDALRTMGIVPIRYLVVPRVVALLVVTPLLTLLGDVSGVVGGALVAVASLHVTPLAYLTELRQSISVGDVLGGLLKASTAGLTIAVIGCQQGFATSGGPAGVGHRTTATVVKSLVALVLIDAFFAFVLGALRR